MYEMIDVSSNNHNVSETIDWKSVKAAGVSGVMIKATQGTNYTNPYLKGDNGCQSDYEDARSAGLDVGFYHYADTGRWQDELHHFLVTIKGLSKQLGCALDLENTYGRSWRQVSNWAQSFLAGLQQNVDWAILYNDPSFLANMSGGAVWGYFLWLADYPSTIGNLSRPPRRRIWAWQYDAFGRIDGIGGMVDKSVLYVPPGSLH